MKRLSTNQIVLFTGIGLYLAGWLTMLIGGYFFDGDDLTQEPVLKILNVFPPIIIFTMTLIYASIFEELAFRSWVMEKKIWKYVSLSLITYVVYSTFGNIFFAIITGAALYFVFFRIKDQRMKIILSVVITSVLFGLIHYANFYGWGKWLAMIQLTGLSFILCYLGMRFGFGFAVLGHFVNNLVAMVLLTAVININYAGEFGDETYTAQISKVSLFQLTSELNFELSEEALSIGNITQIAEDLAPFSHNTIYRCRVSNLNRYRLEVNAVEGHTIDYSALFMHFLDHTGLTTDTTYEMAYVLNIIDTALFKNPDIGEVSPGYRINLSGLVSSFRSIFDAPIVLKEGQTDYNTYQYLDLFSTKELISGSGFAKLQERLLLQYGVSLEADGSTMARIITIRE